MRGFTFSLAALTVTLAILFTACKKNSGGSPDPVPGPDTTHFDPAVDPPVAATMGFFLDDWQPRTFSAPSYQSAAMPSGGTVEVNINPSAIITKIPASLYGNNANQWMGQIVTEAGLMTDFKNLHHGNIIRYPGGSISDVYFWNADYGVKPSDLPEELMNADGTFTSRTPNDLYWYGKNNQNWTISLDNYYNLLQQSGNEGLITVNYGYARYGLANDPVAAAAHLAADWVRYDHGRTKYWEVGNENYGDWERGYRIDVSQNKDGQPEYVTGDLYGKHFRVFADSMKAAAQEIGHTIYIGVVLAEAPPQSWETNTRKNWNTGLLAQIGDKADYYVVHNYYTAYKTNAGAGEILYTAIDVTSSMMNFVRQDLQAKAATIKPIALDEWNITSEGSMQQVSQVNALHADLLLGEALKNKYGMTSRWDLANDWSNGNDHGMFSQGGEPGVAKWTPRPVFYHMYYFQKMMGDRLVMTTVAGNSFVYAYASSFTSGQLGLVLLNTSASTLNTKITFKNFKPGQRVYWYVLSGGTDNGDFSRKVLINGEGPVQAAGGPANYAGIKAYSATITGNVSFSIPARSAIFAVIDKG